jgi:hypothetical protein
MYAKRFVPIQLVASLIIVLLSLSLANAHSKDQCENLTDFFDPLGQLVIDNTTNPPMERLCRKVFKAQKKVNKGKIAKAIKKLNRFINITNNHTPKHLTEAAATLLSTEAGRLIGILEDNMGLPKDPGTAGKATLEGIDSDNDGVRDDLQRLIALTHTDSAKIRTLLTLYSKAFQQILIDADDKTLSIQHSNEKGRLFKCEIYLESELDIDLTPPKKDLIAETMNTDARSRAYIQYNQQVSGRIAGLNITGNFSEQKVFCDFNPDDLPN